MSAAAVPALLAQATAARQVGRFDEARRLIEGALAGAPGHPGALNALALLLLARGDPAGAALHLAQAVEVDPKAPPLWLNLADARRQAGDAAGELAALDRALTLDPYMLPALLRKAQALERGGRSSDSARAYRALLTASPDSKGLPPEIVAALDHGRSVIAAEDAARAAAVAGPVEAAAARYSEAELVRARAYVDHLTGRRKIYHNEPTGGHFPFLPAFEYFDRSLFPWMPALEAATDAIRDELLTLWREGIDRFEPYVRYAPGTPVNQWAELNHSPRWGAYFLWRDGRPVPEALARCPATAAAIAAVPLLDIPGRAPTVMFSMLDPHTRIPPHTGTTNARTTVHLPLVVPEGCGFRVGGETREWVEGTAWGFDDTIEHEAWNDSDRPRAILILDVWNPLLSAAERDVVRAATGVIGEG